MSAAVRKLLKEKTEAERRSLEFEPFYFQLDDQLCIGIAKDLSDTTNPQKLAKLMELFLIKNGLVFRKIEIKDPLDGKEKIISVPVVPKVLRSTILRLAHESPIEGAHLGKHK